MSDSIEFTEEYMRKLYQFIKLSENMLSEWNELHKQYPRLKWHTMLEYSIKFHSDSEDILRLATMGLFTEEKLVSTLSSKLSAMARIKKCIDKHLENGMWKNCDGLCARGDDGHDEKARELLQ